MSRQHQSILSSLSATLLSCILAALFFVASVWYPLHLWRPLTCALNKDGSCDFDPVVALLGVAIAALVHASSVAVFAWTPLSAPLRATSQDSKLPSMFNAFLYMSMISDIIAYGNALSFIEDFTGFVQALTISFNAPFLIFAPYVLAAYRDPSTDLGSLIHRIKARIQAHHCDEQQASCGDSECMRGRMERAFLILPNSLEREGDVGDVREFASEEKEKMRPFPKFSLFVTAPTDSSLEQYMPLPVSQRA